MQSKSPCAVARSVTAPVGYGCTTEAEGPEPRGCHRGKEGRGQCLISALLSAKERGWGCRLGLSPSCPTQCFMFAYGAPGRAIGPPVGVQGEPDRQRLPHPTPPRLAKPYLTHSGRGQLRGVSLQPLQLGNYLPRHGHSTPAPGTRPSAHHSTPRRCRTSTRLRETSWSIGWWLVAASLVSALTPTSSSSFFDLRSALYRPNPLGTLCHSVLPHPLSRALYRVDLFTTFRN